MEAGAIDELRDAHGYPTFFTETAKGIQLDASREDKPSDDYRYYAPSANEYRHLNCHVTVATDGSGRHHLSIYHQGQAIGRVYKDGFRPPKDTAAEPQLCQARLATLGFKSWKSAGAWAYDAAEEILRDRQNYLNEQLAKASEKTASKEKPKQSPRAIIAKKVQEYRRQLEEKGEKPFKIDHWANVYEKKLKKEQEDRESRERLKLIEMQVNGPLKGGSNQRPKDAAKRRPKKAGKLYQEATVQGATPDEAVVGTPERTAGPAGSALNIQPNTPGSCGQMIYDAVSTAAEYAWTPVQYAIDWWYSAPQVAQAIKRNPKNFNKED